MTGRRKSCKTCKKAAANSLPFLETNVPVVDGFLYQNNDHDENPTPGFSSHVADAISDPATAGIAAADAALGRTEPTPGFRKTANRKAAIQASSFTAVAQQTSQQSGAANDKDSNKDGGKLGDESKKSSCADKKDPEDAAGCSDQHVFKSAVAVSARLQPEGILSSKIIFKFQKHALSQISSPSDPLSHPTAIKFKLDSKKYDKSLDDRFEGILGTIERRTSEKFHEKINLLYETLSTKPSQKFKDAIKFTDYDNDQEGMSKHYTWFQGYTFNEYKGKHDPQDLERQFVIDTYLFIAEVGIHRCFDGLHGTPKADGESEVEGKVVTHCHEDFFGADEANFPDPDDLNSGKKLRRCVKNVSVYEKAGKPTTWSCFYLTSKYPRSDVVENYLYSATYSDQTIYFLKDGQFVKSQ